METAPARHRGLSLALAAAALALAAPVQAADEFLRNLRKADSRRESDERIEYYGRAIRAWNPDHGGALLAHSHFGRGKAHAERYEWEQAEADLTKTVDLDPRNDAAQFLRGKARLRLGRYGDAARDLEAYLGANPRDIEAFAELGEAHLKAGNLSAALRAHRLAAEMAPADFRPALGTAKVRAAQGRWSAALQFIDSADELAKGRAPEVLTEKAACLFALGRPEPSLKAWDAAVPLLESRLEDMKRSRAVAGRLAEARQLLAEAHFGRGRLNEFLVKVPAARADYGQACALGHKEACLKAEALAPAPEAPKPPLLRPRPQPKPAPAKKPKIPKKKRLPKPKSKPGERIYVH